MLIKRFRAVDESLFVKRGDTCCRAKAWAQHEERSNNHQKAYRDAKKGDDDALGALGHINKPKRIISSKKKWLTLHLVIWVIMAVHNINNSQERKRQTSRMFCANLFWKILPNSKVNTCNRDLFLVQSKIPTCTLFKNRSLSQVLSCDSRHIFQKSYSTKHLSEAVVQRCTIK